MNLRQGDSLELLKSIPTGSVNLVLTDPPYNIAKADWDKIPDYIEWCKAWMQEVERVLADNGVFYWFHNDMEQMAQLMEMIRYETDFCFRSFIVWDKGQTYRAITWKNPSEGNTLRSWFPTTEYIMHYTLNGKESSTNKTGLDMINSNAECYKPLKDWYAAEKARLQITDKDIAAYYTQVTGKKPYMLHHYFRDSQFEIPTESVWNSVYVPLGFGKEYEELRQEYEELRYYHKPDKMHNNVFSCPTISAGAAGRSHPTQKPVEILERLINVSCKPGGVVLDPFMGSGSTGVACVRTGREFIGIEKDSKYFEIAQQRIQSEENENEHF